MFDQPGVPGAPPKELVKKLIEVMSSVGRVAKTGYNSFQKYSYATEADILETVRQELASRNVFVFSSVDHIFKQEDLTTVRVSFTFVDGDTGASHTVMAAGQGADKGDKGIYKAITGASKYMFLKNFLLPTGDDPENEKGATVSKPAPAVAKPVLAAPTKPAPTEEPAKAEEATKTRPSFNKNRAAKPVETNVGDDI